MRALAFLVLPLIVTACGGGGGEPEPNLPTGWEEASRLADFSQSACGGDPADDPTRTAGVDLLIASGAATTTMTNIVFRCDQPLEAWVRRTDTVDLLVQPIDVNPVDPARCDCFYDLEFSFNVFEDESTFVFYLRRDEAGGPSRPSELGRVTAE